MVRLGVYASPVFDTQIAHRIIREADEVHSFTTDFMKNSASLNTLLQTYLHVANTHKDSVGLAMKEDPHLWLKRPLSEELLDYAC